MVSWSISILETWSGLVGSQSVSLFVWLVSNMLTIVMSLHPMPKLWLSGTGRLSSSPKYKPTDTVVGQKGHFLGVAFHRHLCIGKIYIK